MMLKNGSGQLFKKRLKVFIFLRSIDFIDTSLFYVKYFKNKKYQIWYFNNLVLSLTKKLILKQAATVTMRQKVMLDLKNFSVNNQVSLSLLLTTRKELSEKRQSLINECVKYQNSFDKSYLKNPDYVKLQETLKTDLETVTHISNCINLYVKYGNVSGNEICDDRPELNYVISFQKATKKSFNKEIHKLGVVIIYNTLTKTSFNKGVNESVCEDFCIDNAKNHKEVEQRFLMASNALYEVSDFYTINDYIKAANHRVVFGYRDQQGTFFETDYIS